MLLHCNTSAQLEPRKRESITVILLHYNSVITVQFHYTFFFSLDSKGVFVCQFVIIL